MATIRENIEQWSNQNPPCRRATAHSTVILARLKYLTERTESTFMFNAYMLVKYSKRKQEVKIIMLKIPKISSWENGNSFFGPSSADSLPGVVL